MRIQRVLEVGCKFIDFKEPVEIDLIDGDLTFGEYDTETGEYKKIFTKIIFDKMKIISDGYHISDKFKKQLKEVF